MEPQPLADPLLILRRTDADYGKNVNLREKIELLGEYYVPVPLRLP